LSESWQRGPSPAAPNWGIWCVLSTTNDRRPRRGALFREQSTTQSYYHEQDRSPVLQAIALAVLALAHLFDYGTFLVMVDRHGLSAEANPIVAMLAQEVGIPGLTVAKFLTVGLAAVLMVVIAPRRKKLAMGLLMFGVAAGLLGGISNIATI
jgi:hypothetical protein